MTSWQSNTREPRTVAHCWWVQFPVNVDLLSKSFVLAKHKKRELNRLGRLNFDKLEKYQKEPKTVPMVKKKEVQGSSL